MRTQQELKHLLALEIASRAASNDILGVGSGSTVLRAVACLGHRIRAEGLVISAVVASIEAEDACLAAGMNVLSSPRQHLSWAFDGADEVDPGLNALKGLGGAILRERVVAASAKQWILAVDETKLVEKLGVNAPLVIELIPRIRNLLPNMLSELGASDIQLRRHNGDGPPVITESGNVLFDCKFPDITQHLANTIRLLPGVVECGLFEGMATEVLVARQDGIWSGARSSEGTRWSLLRSFTAGASGEVL